MAVVELEIPAKSAYVGVARLAVGALARAAGMHEEAVDDLRIAVSEACTNAVLGTETTSPDAPVSVTWSEEPCVVVVEVADRGPVYDPETATEEDTQGIRLSLSVSLLRSLVDECEISARPDGGMCTRLVIRR
jgi:serine/threonine-protein kinase RsbW